MKKEILPGTRFARLVVTGLEKPYIDPKSGRIQIQSLCLCDCGKTTTVRDVSLRIGNTKSCGCLAAENRVKLARERTTHGQAHTLTHQIWVQMKQRCSNPKNPAFKKYGGRGISVCERWNDFSNFLKDMGERPKGFSIERINNDLGYCKENCKWATRKEQQRNTRSNHLVSHNGLNLTVAEWAEKTGMAYGTLLQRLDRGWSPERAITEPSYPRTHAQKFLANARCSRTAIPLTASQ